MPKDIPFNLHLISVMALCSIILLYIFALYKPLTNKNENSHILRYLLIVKPLAFLDDNFKDYIKVNTVLLQNIINSISTAPPLFYDLITIFRRFPRFILSLLFFIDVFIRGQIYYTYKGIWLLIFLLIIEYILYSLKKIKEKIITNIEEKIKLHEGDVSGPVISIEHFLDLQANTLLNNKPTLKYDLMLNYDYTIKLRKELDKIRKGIRIKTKPIYAEQEKHLTKALTIAKILNLMQQFNKKYTFIIFVTRMLYLICWGYILFVSWSTFHLLPQELLFIIKFQEIIEPFSGVKIW